MIRVPSSYTAYRRLVGPDGLPGARGSLTAETLPAGAWTEAEPTAESATLVLSGRARYADRLLTPGDGLYHPPGSRYRLIAVDGAPLRLLTVRGEPAEGPAATTGPVPFARRREQGGDLTRAGGFAGMGVHWLATSTTVGSRRLTVATSTFTPGGSHDLHRHPHADEFFLVLAGGGEHLTEAGPTDLSEGDLAYVPAGEWHGFRTHPGTTTVALYGYLGAGSLRQAGYEVRSEETPGEATHPSPAPRREFP